MTKKRILLAVAAGLVVVIGFVIYQSILGSTFRLESTSPDLGSEIPSSTPRITLTFNRDLKPDQEIHNKISGDVSPIVNLTIEKNQLIVHLSALDPGSDYSLVIKDIESQDGEIIEQLDFKYQAVYVPYNQLTKEQKATQLAATDHNNKEDPIIDILPVEGEGYYLSGNYTTADDGTEEYTIEAQIFLKRWDVNNRQAAIDRYKQSIVDYITSKGFNVDDYFIDYIIIDPPSI